MTNLVPLVSKEDEDRLQREYEEEAKAYFESLDYGFDRYKITEKIHPLPVAKIYKRPWMLLRKLWEFINEQYKNQRWF